MSSFEKRLRAESVAWVADGVVSDAQREALLARHPEHAAGGKRFVAILTAVGGALVLTGVCLLIGANWQEIGDWAKIGGLVALLVGAYGAGWKLRVARPDAPWWSDTLFMMGAGLFMAGIALVSQIFHLDARPASGVLLWFLGIVAVPWLTRSKGAQFLALAAFLVWLGMEMETRGGWLELTTGARYDYAGYALVAAFALLGLAVWLAGLALRGTRYAAFAGLHEKWGAFIVCGALYVLGFIRHDWRWRDESTVFDVRLAPIALAAALVAVAAWAAWRTSRRELRGLGAWWALALVPVAGVLGQWLPKDGGIVWSAWAWMSLFALNLAMVRVGSATEREGWVNLALGFIALNIVTRYFDLFGTMLQGGVFFVLTGIVVIVLGIFIERKRRGVLSAMRVAKEGAR